MSAPYNYQGFHIKIKHTDLGDYIVPDSFIAVESYQSTASTTDLDPYRDANAILHRNALATINPKVEFNTPYMVDKYFNDIMYEIRRRFINTNEKRVRAVIWNTEVNDYIEQDYYIPDITTTVYSRKTMLERVGGVLQTRVRHILMPTRIAFIGYGE